MLDILHSQWMPLDLLSLYFLFHPCPTAIKITKPASQKMQQSSTIILQRLTFRPENLLQRSRNSRRQTVEISALKLITRSQGWSQLHWGGGAQLASEEEVVDLIISKSFVRFTKWERKYIATVLISRYSPHAQPGRGATQTSTIFSWRTTIDLFFFF